jgi:uncharacterized protein YcfJ
MNKSLLIGLIVGAGATAGVGTLASLALKSHSDTQPQIVAAEPALPSAADAADPGAEIGEATESTAPELSANADSAVPAAITPAPTPAPRVEKPVHSEPGYARVVSVQPVSRTVSEPREICQDVEVVQQAPVRDQHQIAGTVIGGVIGGVIGNQIGDGDGRKIAKVAGAIGGAYAGNKVQERIQKSRTVTTIEKKCETVYESREVPDGYRVTYEWEGEIRTVKMDSDPGDRLPVRGGEVILTANAR